MFSHDDVTTFLVSLYFLDAHKVFDYVNPWTLFVRLRDVP